MKTLGIDKACKSKIFLSKIELLKRTLNLLIFLASEI